MEASTVQGQPTPDAGYGASPNHGDGLPTRVEAPSREAVTIHLEEPSPAADASSEADASLDMGPSYGQDGSRPV